MSEWVALTGCALGQKIDVRIDLVAALEPLTGANGAVIGTVLHALDFEIKVREKPDEVRALLGIRR